MRKKGSSTLEIIIYTVILIIISIFVINSIIIVNTAFTRVRLLRRLSTNGDQAMQKIVREIRLAQDLNASSSFAIDPGDISLATYVSATNSQAVNADFYLSQGRLVLKKWPKDDIFLTDKGTKITSLVFRQVNASTSKAITIQLGLEVGNSKTKASSTFYGTAILRGSYD